VHCTISLERRLLCGSGFNCVTFSSSHPQEDRLLVFLAQKAGADHRMLPPTVKRLASPRHPHGNGNAKTCYAPEIFASKDLSRLHLHKEPLVHVSAPILSYSRGREMRLRDQLTALDVAEACRYGSWPPTVRTAMRRAGSAERSQRSCRLGRSTPSSAKHAEVESRDARKGPEKGVQWHGKHGGAL
jgi:hypothetical protein